jgi:hypothetical protein
MPLTGVTLDHDSGLNAASDIWLMISVSYTMAPFLVFLTLTLTLAGPVSAL